LVSFTEEVSRRSSKLLIFKRDQKKIKNPGQVIFRKKNLTENFFFLFRDKVFHNPTRR
jgi:hypothetical protein